MSFSQLNLHAKINQAITACQYKNPTPIQSMAIPHILDGKDIVATAQTGTGKTAAFVLPALHLMSLKKHSNKTQILILTPTRELAAQITKAAATYGKFLNFKVASLVGGMPYYPQIKALSQGANIVVATPGRLLDHIKAKRIDLSQVEMLVLDEADRMLDMGFIDDVQEIASMTPKHRQTLFFSATIDKNLSQVVKRLLKSPITINLSNEKLAAPKIKQELYKVNNLQHKRLLLKHFLNDTNIFKAIIFSATKVNADRLANDLRDQGYSAAALHGDLKQNVRNRTIEKLRRGNIQFLVATDVAARGIDISDITHVINYDLPKFSEDYVHRIGRTGRAGREGTAISFVLPTDFKHLQRIERYVGRRFNLMPNIAVDSKQDPFIATGTEAERAHTHERDRTRSRGERDRTRSHGERDRTRSHGERDRTKSHGERSRTRTADGESRRTRTPGESDGKNAKPTRLKTHAPRRAKKQNRNEVIEMPRRKRPQRSERGEQRKWA